MAVIRFDPFRDPFGAAVVHGRDGDVCPARHAYGRLPRGGWQLPRRGRPAGVDSDSIEVTVEHSTLTIRAERTPHHGDSEQVIVAEQPQGSFTRQLSLGEGVDPENLTADYADGVLHLTISVSPETRARRVEITHAPGGSRTLSGEHVRAG
jgi:HSP20 family protein